MADELTVSMSATLRNGTLIDGFRPDTFRVDQAAALLEAGVQVIGFAAHEIVTVGDVTTRGYAAFQNLDATNFVQIGRDVSGTFVELPHLLPGEVALFPVSPSAVIYAKADTAAVNLKKWILSR